MREVSEAFHASALAQVPAGGLDWAGFVAVPTGSGSAVAGREYPVIGGGRAVLLVGPDGVSLRSAAGVVTVRFDEVAAMESFADGGRWVVGTDGFRVHLEPTVFALDEAAVAAVDAAVDPARVVRRPGREAAQLPRPAAGGEGPRVREPSSLLSRLPGRGRGRG